MTFVMKERVNAEWFDGGCVVNRSPCAVETARRTAVEAHELVCGTCVFGREGTRQLAEVLTDMVEGRGVSSDLDLLSNVCDGMKHGSLCKNGRCAAEAVMAFMQESGPDFAAHLAGNCPAGVCKFERAEVKR
jgi:NADH-quinone oxidoreductase subunit F